MNAKAAAEKILELGNNDWFYDEYPYGREEVSGCLEGRTLAPIVAKRYLEAIELLKKYAMNKKESSEGTEWSYEPEVGKFLDEHEKDE